ncbi:MAG: hypothetical protein K0R73_1444, partial [Candidatus Midichloriaceae bacterium]|nr:hypothetical protein [Candidatus Midichloriaceae bacterium]
MPAHMPIMNQKEVLIYTDSRDKQPFIMWL